MNSNDIQIPTENELEEAKENGASSEKKRHRLPLVCKIIYCLAGLCVLLYIAFLLSPEFSDIFNKYVSPLVRGALAILTGWIPFSLSELLLLLVPVFIVSVVVLGIKRFADSWRNVLIFSLTVLSVAAYVFSTFTLGFVPAYRGSTLDEKMGLDKQPVSAEELYQTTLIVIEELAAIEEEIGYKKDGFSVMPYSYGELNDKLMEAYDAACEKYDFIPKLHSRFKRIMLSEPMTYTHISGVYTFFTGEANINTNFPDYTLPFTAAHELAHQRGIAREDEANFVAFLVCKDSEDVYLRYSAYLNMYEYLANALYSANKDYYQSAYSLVPSGARKEMRAFSQFFDKYRDNVMEEVSETVNDTFLTINGTEGTKSYGMVVDLAVAYYKAD